MKQILITVCLALLLPAYINAQLLTEVEKSPDCVKIFDKGKRVRSNQGMAINGNYIFNFLDGGGCQVFDIRKSGEVPIAEFQLESAQKDNHTNQVNFGSLTLPGAAAPLAYITVGKVGVPIEFTCYVESFRRKGKRWSSELVQKITLDTTGFGRHDILRIFGAPSWLVDRKRNELWVFSALKRTILKTTKEPFNNKYIALKFRIPALEEGKEVKLGYKDVLDQRIFEFDTYVTQGGCADDGKLYYSFGFGNSHNAAHPSKIRVYDTDRRVISSRYDLDTEIPEECECISIPGDGYMYINTNSSNIYRIPLKEDIFPDIEEDPLTLLRKFPEMTSGIYWIPSMNFPEERTVPVNYEPYYIGACGKVGMRYLDDAETLSLLKDYFIKADSLGILTPLGNVAKDRFNMIFPSIASNIGALTQGGMQQWRSNARRSVENYPEIFSDNLYVDLESDDMTSLALSLANFDIGLREVMPKIDARMHIGSEGNKLHKGFNDDIRGKTCIGVTKNMQGVSSPLWLDFARKKIDGKAFVSRIMTDIDAMEMSEDDLVELEYAFFKLHCNARSLDMPMLFDDLFTEDEILAWWEVDNFKYLNEGVDHSSCPKTLPEEGSRILDKMLNTAEDHLRNVDGKGFNLRIVDDGDFLDLLIALDADRWGEETNDWENVKDLRKTYLVPAASMLCMNFYRNSNRPDDDILVKVLLNEKSLRLPLAEISDRCYRWTDFYTFYKDLVAKRRLQQEYRGI